MYGFTVEGIHVSVSVSYHACVRMNERGVVREVACDALALHAESILDFRFNQRFVLLFNDLGIALVCCLERDGFDVSLNVITAFPNTFDYYNTPALSL